MAYRGKEPADDPYPVPPEVDQQRDRGRDVQPDDEGQVRGLGAGDVEVGLPAAAHEGGKQDVVPEAGDGEQLRDALDQADDGSFQVSQLCHVSLSHGGSWPCARSLRGVWTCAQETYYEVTKPSCLLDDERKCFAADFKGDADPSREVRATADLALEHVTGPHTSSATSSNRYINGRSAYSAGTGDQAPEPVNNRSAC